MFTCHLGDINMTADGGARIRKAIEVEQDQYYLSMRIEKLIVSSSASGPFLQRIATLTEKISYLTYNDPVFQVPAGNTLTEIEIVDAEKLRTIMVGMNRHLKRLYVENCLLDRIPPTLSSMVMLENLDILHCALTALRLDVLVNNRKLTIVDLTRNRIRQLFPITSPPKEMLPTTVLILAANQLERLDMAMFAFMPELEWLDVRGNRIVRFEVTVPTTYSSLIRLLVSSNRITQFDTRNLTLPQLVSLYLDDNALTAIPTQWGSMPELYYIGLDRNDLRQVDMSIFAQLPNLRGIYISDSKVESVRTSTPLTLPSLEMMLFENNQIVSVNFGGCNFPQLFLISLINNRLTTVPTLFQRFPKTRLSVDGNPIRCSSMSALRNKFIDGKLYLSTANTQSECATTSSIQLETRIRNAIEAQEYQFFVSLSIAKLIVSSTASGPFLQRIATLTEKITYLIYRDPVFQVPADNTLSEIEIIDGVMLRSIVAGRNNHLTRLSLSNCLLDRIPPTLSSMIVLQQLFILRCRLTVLRLDVLLNNHRLTTVDLTRNQIRQLFPITSPPKEMMAIKTFGLAANQLQYLDMAMFAFMPELEQFDVRGNRIVRFEATVPTTYSSLIRLFVSSNRITQFDTRNLTLPQLVSLYLDDNALTAIPTQWGSMPELYYIGINRNDLRQVDMSIFARFPILGGIYISESKVESVRTSTPLTLPSLEMILLDNNQIVSINFTGCNFPRLSYISLAGNRITTVPPLFQRFPTTRLSVDSNPIRCSSMTALRSRITQRTLFVTTASTQSECGTTSSIQLESNLLGCCNA
uniref:Leucine rich immune protein (Coil-less) n=1 Tax=Anopheles epiroticus TaxID=199890 RepID=A0A182PQF9_9DIPT